MKNTPLLLIPVILAGCVYPRPGMPAKQTTSGTAMTGAMLGAGAGAAIGHNQDGSRGALIGAATGALVGTLTTNAVANFNANQIEEAAEAARREERARVMNDYWQSMAIDGGNSDQTTQSTQTARPKSVPVVYPSGVYDGVLMAPRVQATE